MNRPQLNHFNTIAPILTHEYERYLPTAFDESMSLLQKVNKVIRELNRISVTVNDVIGNWNKVMEWLLDEGLSAEVEGMLNEWYENGKLETIINEALFNGKLDKKTFEDYLEDYSKDKADNLKRINNLMIDLSSSPYNAKSNTDIGVIMIQAVDAIHANGGGKIKIPAGDYIIDASVDLPSNIEIIGDKGGTILRKSVNAIEGYMFTAGRLTKYGAKSGYGGGGKNIGFEGIEFHGYAPSDSNAKAIALSFHHADNLTFKECRFYRVMTRDHAIDLAGCSNVLIDHCSFEGAFNFAGREYNECIQIDSSAPTALPQFHSYDGLPTKNVTIRECQFIPSYNPDGSIFSYAPHPVGTHGHTGGKPYENIVFENNLVLDGQPKTSPAGWRGWIHFYGVKNLKIKNNRFLNTRSILTNVIGIYTSSAGRYDPNTLVAGVGVPTISSDIEVSGNTFEGFDNMSENNNVIRMYGTEYEGVEYPIRNVTVRDNEFINNADNSFRQLLGQTCVHISLFEWVKITGNTADTGARLASVWDGSHVVVSGNNARKLSTAFIYNSSSKNVIISNNVADELRRPLEILEVDNISIMGNVFTGVRQIDDQNYANRIRNVSNGSLMGNVTVAGESSMSYGYYVYQTDGGSSSDVNNFDNIAVGFTSRAYNMSGEMNNYVTRPSMV